MKNFLVDIAIVTVVYFFFNFLGDSFILGWFGGILCVTLLNLRESVSKLFVPKKETEKE
jgi:hypothetical protein